MGGCDWPRVPLWDRQIRLSAFPSQSLSNTVYSTGAYAPLHGQGITSIVRCGFPKLPRGWHLLSHLFGGTVPVQGILTSQRDGLAVSPNRLIIGRATYKIHSDRRNGHCYPFVLGRNHFCHRNCHSHRHALYRNHCCRRNGQFHRHAPYRSHCYQRSDQFHRHAPYKSRYDRTYGRHYPFAPDNYQKNHRNFAL